MLDDGWPRLFGVFAVEVLLWVALVEPDSGRPVVPAVQPDEASEPLLHRLIERIIGGTHIGKHRAAL